VYVTDGRGAVGRGAVGRGCETGGVGFGVGFGSAAAGGGSGSGTGSGAGGAGSVTTGSVGGGSWPNARVAEAANTAAAISATTDRACVIRPTEVRNLASRSRVTCVGGVDTSTKPLENSRSTIAPGVGEWKAAPGQTGAPLAPYWLVRLGP
jgi:hypothetical protein